MNKEQKEKRDELMEAAKVSKDPTVTKALEKLLFAVSLAHNEDYIKWANQGTFHSGCTITIPATEHTTTYQLTWNDETMQVFSIEYQVASIQYGHIYDQKDPIPGIILIEDKNFL